MKIRILLTMLAILFFVAGCGGNEQQKKKEPETAKGSSAHKGPGYIFGKVKETMNGGGYTYVLVEFEGKETWVAIPETSLKVGQEVMLYPGQVMRHFESKSLNRTFDSIVFSQGIVSDSAPSTPKKNVSQAQSAHQQVPRITKIDLKLEPLKKGEGVTIEEIYKRADELNGKKIKVKAKVMKVSKNILGKNWLHCQDGTGSQKANNFDLTVTTKAEPKVGDVVIIEGVLRKDKDIGAGYFYKVLIEDAKVTKVEEPEKK